MAYVRTRLGRLFYEERGGARRSDDPVIVLLHGLLFDGGMWSAQVEPLAQLGRVVVLDGPGHGKSEPAPRFMLEDHAHALFDACGDLGIARAVLVGLSWGGMTAMRFALQYPKLVAGLGLLDTSAGVDPLRKRLRYRAFIAMHRRVGTPHALYQRELAPLLFSQATQRERPEMVEAAYRRTMGFDRGGLARAANAVVVHRTDLVKELPRIQAPTLVLWGSEDASTSPDVNAAIADGIPGARRAVIEGAGHMSPLEDPVGVNAHLVPFVGSCIDRAV